MRKKLDHKVPGGKLVRVEVDVEGGIVRRALVRGDFFAHPEEAFEAAEALLAGVPCPELVARAELAFSRPDLVLYGVTAAAIAETLGRALDAPAAP